MNNMLNQANPTSHENLTKLAKEKLNPVVNIQKKPDKSKCGSDNPCNFGTPNINFNKYCLCQ